MQVEAAYHDPVQAEVRGPPHLQAGPALSLTRFCPPGRPRFAAIIPARVRAEHSCGPPRHAPGLLLRFLRLVPIPHTKFTCAKYDVPRDWYLMARNSPTKNSAMRLAAPPRRNCSTLD